MAKPATTAEDWLRDYHGSIDATALLMAFRAGQQTTAPPTPGSVIEAARVLKEHEDRRWPEATRDHAADQALAEGRAQALADAGILPRDPKPATPQLEQAAVANYAAFAGSESLLASAQSTLERVSALHQASGSHHPDCSCGLPPEDGARCIECDRPWPCPTAQTLEAAL